MEEKSTSNKKWKPLNWPWEFELLILFILVSFVAYASHVENRQTEINQKVDAMQIAAERAREQAQLNSPEAQGWQEIKEISKTGEPINPLGAAEAQQQEETRTGTAFLPFVVGMSRTSWFLVLALLYLAHIVLSRFSPNFVSTSLWMMIAPMVFTFIGYTYLISSYSWNGTAPAFRPEFSPALLFSLMAVVYFISFMLARVRMQRVAIRLKGSKWIIEVPPATAKGQLARLLGRIQPIFYSPRNYKLSEEGLLIEGWHYVITIPLQEVKNIRKRDEGGIVGPGFYVVRTMERLVQLDIFSNDQPIMIGPNKQELFLEKARETLLELKKRPHQRDAA